MRAPNHYKCKKCGHVWNLSDDEELFGLNQCRNPRCNAKRKHFTPVDWRENPASWVQKANSYDGENIEHTNP